MIVDCHTHIDFDANEPDFSGHLDAIKAVDACIVMALPGQNRQKANEQLARYVESHKNRMIGFGVVDPTDDKVDDALLWKMTDTLGLKGFVFYCAAHAFQPNHSLAMRFYGIAQELRIPIYFHGADLDINGSGILTYAQPHLLDEIARAFPELKLIIGSMGLPYLDQALAVIARHKNVFGDLTIRPKNVWQTYNTVSAAYELGVMDRLLFGSGYPSGNPVTCIETLLGFNMLFADTSLPIIPRASIRLLIERNTFDLLGISSEQPERLLLEIHIPDADPDNEWEILERIRQATGVFLSELGYMPDPKTSLTFSSSWHWREWFRRKSPEIRDESRGVYREIKESLRRANVDQPGAAAFEKRAVAASQLLGSLECYDEAVVRLGDVIMVKLLEDGKSRLVIETISPEVARDLEKNYHLLENPQKTLHYLMKWSQIPDKTRGAHSNIQPPDSAQKSLDLEDSSANNESLEEST